MRWLGHFLTNFSVILKGFIMMPYNAFLKGRLSAKINSKKSLILLKFLIVTIFNLMIIKSALCSVCKQSIET